MVRSFWKDEVTVSRAGIKPSTHNPDKGQLDWSAATHTTWTTCRVQFGSTERNAEQRYLWRYTVYLPLEASVEVGDRITFTDPAGKTVTVDVAPEGPPIYNRGPIGMVGHCRVNLVRSDS